MASENNQMDIHLKKNDVQINIGYSHGFFNLGYHISRWKIISAILPRSNWERKRSKYSLEE